jgi:hypothetical protein
MDEQDGPVWNPDASPHTKNVNRSILRHDPLRREVSPARSKVVDNGDMPSTATTYAADDIQDGQFMPL